MSDMMLQDMGLFRNGVAKARDSNRERDLYMDYTGFRFTVRL